MSENAQSTAARSSFHVKDADSPLLQQVAHTLPVGLGEWLFGPMSSALVVSGAADMAERDFVAISLNWRHREAGAAHQSAAQIVRCWYTKRSQPRLISRAAYKCQSSRTEQLVHPIYRTYSRRACGCLFDFCPTSALHRRPSLSLFVYSTPPLLCRSGITLNWAG
jgi:hypothetical protein